MSIKTMVHDKRIAVQFAGGILVKGRVIDTRDPDWVLMGSDPYRWINLSQAQFVTIL